MADGSILFAAYDTETTAQGVYLWSAAAGFTQPPGLGFLAYSVRDIVPSGDRMHAFLSEDSSGGSYARYDVSTGTAISKTVYFGSQPTVLAVNQDGSRAVILYDCCGFALTDANFNPIAHLTGIYNEGFLAEPDFSRFYEKSITSNYVLVLDANFNQIGSLAGNFTPEIFARTEFRAFDGKHRILSLAASGIAFLDTSTISPVPSTSAVYPEFPASGIVYSSFSPPTPEGGLTTTLTGVNFPSTPSVVLSEGPTSLRATLSGSNKITVPSFPGECADAAATLASGVQAFAPQAFCYKPKVFARDGDAGPTSGGSTLTLYGMGFGGATPTVTIGEVASPRVTQKFAYGTISVTGIVFGFSTLTVVVPPNPMGDADITIQTSFGSTTLPRAFHYAQRTDSPLPANASPQHVLLDAARGRILVTDAANNHLLVYGLASGALLNTIATGNSPQGMSLTPDGTRLLLVSGDYKVSVLDANSYATLQQVTTPSTGKSVFGTEPVGPPIQVAAMNGNKAYVVTQQGYLQGSAGAFSFAALFDYDLTANMLVEDSLGTFVFSGGEAFYLASSRDGSTALIGSLISHAVGSTPTGSDTTLSSFGDLAVAADGNVAAIEDRFFNGSLLWQNSTTADQTIESQAGLGESFLYGEQFNGTASLYLRPAASHIRIYDAQHANLLRTLAIPDTFTGSTGSQTTSPTRLLAVNPAGQQVIAVTSAGLSIFTFAGDPLSIAQAKYTAGSLVLLGSGFASSTQVLVDALPLTPTFVSTTELDLALPSLSSGVHSVTATNADGTSYTLTMAFTSP